MDKDTRLKLMGSLLDLSTKDAPPLRLRKLGLSPSEVNEALQDPTFFNELWNSASQLCLIPFVPQVLSMLAGKAVAGDGDSIKTFLEIIGKRKGDQSTSMNFALLTDDQLVSLVKRINEDVKLIAPSTESGRFNSGESGVIIDDSNKSESIIIDFNDNDGSRS